MNGWIGVDLDGTLVFHDHGTFHYATIGEPILPMIARVNGWLDDGIEVRLVTARAGLPDAELAEFTANWHIFCDQNLRGRRLPVTDRKDFRMIELWDDRAVQVIPNTGIPLELS